MILVVYNFKTFETSNEKLKKMRLFSIPAAGSKLYKYLPCGSVFSLTSRRGILFPDLLLIGSGCQLWVQHKNAVTIQSACCFWDESFDGHLEVFGENMRWNYGYEWQVWLVCGARGLAALIEKSSSIARL